MSDTSLPHSGMASEILGALPEPDPTDPQRLVKFVDAVSGATPEAAAPEPTVEMVVFVLDGGIFAVPVVRVREVARVQAVARVPQAPEHVRGLFNLRGRVLPVLEVRTRLGLAPAELGPESRLLVVEGHRRLLGLLVDAVRTVERIPVSAVSAPPEEVRTRSSDHVTGVATVGGAVALVLDIDRLLVLPPSSQEEQVP